MKKGCVISACAFSHILLDVILLDDILFDADRVFFIGGKGKMQEPWLLAHFG